MSRRKLLAVGWDAPTTAQVRQRGVQEQQQHKAHVVAASVILFTEN
jgi:hypothetical protein